MQRNLRAALEVTTPTFSFTVSKEVENNYSSSPDVICRRCLQNYRFASTTIWLEKLLSERSLVKKVKLLLLLARRDLLGLINFTQIFLLSQCRAERVPMKTSAKAKTSRQKVNAQQISQQSFFFEWFHKSLRIKIKYLSELKADIA